MKEHPAKFKWKVSEWGQVLSASRTVPSTALGIGGCIAKREKRRCFRCHLSRLWIQTSPLPLPGCCAGMLLRACCTLHLGSGDSGCRTELHHDRNLFWPVCHGGMCCGDWCRVEEEEIALLWLLINPMFLKSSWTSWPFPVTRSWHSSCFCVFSGIPEPKMVTLCPSDSNPLYCHYPHSVCCRLPRCRASNRDEWLPECAAELTGEEGAGDTHIACSHAALCIAQRYQTWCWEKFRRKRHNLSLQ